MLKEVTSFNEKAERQKILDGTYPNRIIQGRQRKHIEGTKEFEQNCEKMRKLGSNPSKLYANADMLVKKYKGTGALFPGRGGSLFPEEIIETNSVIGETWVRSLKKHVPTKRIKIVYSSEGVHIIPISDYIPFEDYIKGVKL
ncbi:MAG: polymorphic toxin type 50 domain-containing protein [Oscillospiraceae bacterium]|nr:polymorphic toxin type 50 domain-containing protein [Oscillospiraceae bacterium]